MGQHVSELDFGQIPANISRIILKADSEHTYISGDDTGRTIEKDCPFASQEMADSVLNYLKNVVYQPYSGTDALLDPTAEIGDGITIGGVYSVLAQSTIEFDRMCAADISAPTSDDLDDEYPYETAEKRKLDRLSSKLDSLANELKEISDKIKDLVPGTGLPDSGYVISFNKRDGKVVPKREDYLEFIVEEIQEAIYESWKAEY